MDIAEASISFGRQLRLKTIVGRPERRRPQCLELRDWAWSEPSFAKDEGVLSHDLPFYSLFDRKKRWFLEIFTILYKIISC